MKLIAIRNFSNVPCLRALEIEPKSHPGQIDKGTVFQVDGETMKKIQPEGARLAVAMLVMTRCVAPWSPELAASVKVDAEQDHRREANALRHNQAALLQAAGNALTSTLGSVAGLRPLK